VKDPFDETPEVLPAGWRTLVAATRGSFVGKARLLKTTRWVVVLNVVKDPCDKNREAISAGLRTCMAMSRGSFVGKSLS
jgi:hypothetical protein